ncbi:MAG: RIO1 family regulatory kinase/ATPase [Archangium sp.]
MEKLQALLDDGIIDEIYSQLKTGKEAEVWLVSHRGEAVAAKLYKEREFRNFKNDAGYREGRQVRNSRTQRAMDKGTKFGREASEEAWKSAEADAMETLHKLGVHVPKPVLFYDGVLLMEVIGDAEGRVAPRLVEANITKEQAGPFYERLRGDVVKMLAADLIHGDLSEFNILLGANGPVIIDFPQVVTAAKNSQSEQYFRRDVGNLLRFFSSVDPTIAQKYENDAEEIWRAYVRRYISPHFVPGRGQQKRDGGPRGPQQRREFSPGQPPRRDGAPQQRREFTPSAGQQQRRDGAPNNVQQSRDGAPQPRREFTPNAGQQQRRDGVPQQRREFTPKGGQQQRRDGAPNNGQQSRDGAPQQRREFTPNNGQQSRDGAPQQRREFTPNNGQQPRRDGAPNNAQARRDATPGPQPQQRRGADAGFRGGGRPAGDARPNAGGGHRRRPKRHF